MTTSDPGPPDALAGEPAVEAPARPTFVLRLFIAGGAPRSTWAVRQHPGAVARKHLAGRYDPRGHRHPPAAGAPARGAQLVAAPTLVKPALLPLRRFIGTMADSKSFLVSLDVPADPHPEGKP